MTAYRTLGSRRVWRELTDAHCPRLATWFNPKGEFVHAGAAPSSRERLWNCQSLLGHGDPRYVRLANQIILGTPIDHNHFEGIAAVEVMLRYGDRVSAKARAYLERIVREHLVNLMEVRFGGGGTNNFTCMTTFFLLAAGQLLDWYQWPHALKSVQEVYSGHRLHSMGMNGLRLLAYHSEHEPVFGEFNSPTYTPISLHSLAKIVELIDDPRAKEMALAIELKLWREVLSLYHPNLGLPCGPYSRAYRVDILGQNSNIRQIMCYMGLSKDRSVVTLFDERQKGLVFHHNGDIPFTWSSPPWKMATRFHVPTDAIQELRARRFPHRFEADVYWGPFGHVIPKTRKYISVQGDLLPGGTARIVQVQHANHCLGFRTASKMGHSFPILFHYALVPQVRTMRDVRNVTAAVMFHGAPDQWVPDQTGKPMEAGNFNHAGLMDVAEKNDTLTFRGRGLEELAPIAADELSINTFVPFHFVPVADVSVNDQRFDGQPIRLRTRRAVCRVSEAGFVYEIEYRFPRVTDVALYRWANFVRFAGFGYQGKAKRFSAKQLDGFRVNGCVRVIDTPSR